MRCSCAHAMVVAVVGSGCHLRTSLWPEGQNLMTGGPGPHGLSDQAQAFVAGVLEDLPALRAVARRAWPATCGLSLSAGRRPYRCSGRENRAPGVRLAAASTDASVEVRCLDASANRHLLDCAVLALGLAGIERRLRLLPEVSVDPMPRDCTPPARRCRARVIAHRIRPARRRAARRARPEQARSTVPSLSPTS
jgi:glutamine synthetase